MSIKIAAPASGTKLNLSESVEFRGSADGGIATVSLFSPFGNNRFLLGKASVIRGEWILSYKFNTSGKREVVVSGFDASNTMLDSEEVKIELSESEDAFVFSEPTPAQKLQGLTLWATFYNIHRAQSVVGGEPLLDMAGNSLGPTLSERDWCFAALEGTVQVLEGADKVKTFNFSGQGSSSQVDCAVLFPSLPNSVIQGMNQSRFTIARGEFGDGVKGFSLVPYRTIAVDPKVTPIGSVIYIPDARGRDFSLPSGKIVTHDGYFFAADTGGNINDNHIDVFLGIATSIEKFDFISSEPQSTFDAFTIDNSLITQSLESAHK